MQLHRISSHMLLWNINQPTTTRDFHLLFENRTHLNWKYPASHLRKQDISRALGIIYQKMWKIMQFSKNWPWCFLNTSFKLQTANYIPTKQDAEENFLMFTLDSLHRSWLILSLNKDREGRHFFLLWNSHQGLVEWIWVKMK